MRPPRSTVVALLAAFALLAILLSPARACACCDGDTAVKAVGWSGDGETFLLDAESTAACETARELRTLRRGDGRTDDPEDVVRLLGAAGIELPVVDV